MGIAREARLDLAKKVLPPALLESLLHVFSQGLPHCALAGGTALAGFYAGHRKSDDLDLFTKDEENQRAAVAAVKSLAASGIRLEREFHSGNYYKTICIHPRHSFTVDVVLDGNLFRVGKLVRLERGVQVFDLLTLLKMKAATLVSRCSEKDLFDLIWLFQQFEDKDLADLIDLAGEIDRGATGESLLASVAGATLREEACDFALQPKVEGKKVYRAILEFRQNLVLHLSRRLRQQPPPALKKLVQQIAKFLRD